MSLSSVFVSKSLENIEEQQARLIAPKWDESPQEESSSSNHTITDEDLQIISSSTTATSFRSSVLLMRAFLRLGWSFDNAELQCRGRLLHRLRASVYSIVAVRRLQITLPRLRAGRIKGFSLLKRSTKWADKPMLHLFRSTSFGLLFVATLSSKIKRNHAECAPLNEALELVSAASKVKLDDMLNAGKCKALVQILSFVATYLGMFKFILDNHVDHGRSPSPGLSGCYYVLKEMCRLLRQCLQYIDDCSGINRARMVYAKLESVNTIKFIISDLNTCLHLLAMKVEEFVGNDDTGGTPIPMNLTGKYLDYYLQLQADKDLSNLLSNLKQHAKLPFWKDLRKLLTPAEVSNSSQLLLIARLEYDNNKSIAIEDEIDALKHGLRVENKSVKVVKFIGAGSYGKVEEVECFGERYAMKTIMSNIENAKEAVIQARLQHPHIVKLIWYTTNGDLEDSKNSISLLMELMDMGLDDYLGQRAHLHKAPLYKYPLLALHLMLQIAEAMKYLHSQGIMHRDLKASNVLVDLSRSPDFTREGYFTVKLCDFGLAKVKKEGAHSFVNTAKVGTRYWRAPEVFAGSTSTRPSDEEEVASYSFSADVYSYAMTCYEILTGMKPYENHNTAGLKQRIVSLQERPSLPEDDMHPQLVRLIKQCWGGTPDARPSFHTICQELQHVKQELIFGQRN